MTHFLRPPLSPPPHLVYRLQRSEQEKMHRSGRLFPHRTALYLAFIWANMPVAWKALGGEFSRAWWLMVLATMTSLSLISLVTTDPGRVPSDTVQQLCAAEVGVGVTQVRSEPVVPSLPEVIAHCQCGTAGGPRCIARHDTKGARPGTGSNTSRVVLDLALTPPHPLDPCPETLAAAAAVLQ